MGSEEEKEDKTDNENDAIENASCTVHEEEIVLEAETIITVEKNSSIGLPMTEASDAWLDYLEGGIGFDDSDEEKDVPDDNLSKDKTSLATEVKSTIGLPMTDASEAWMDDLGDGFDFEDSDNENGEQKLNNISKDAAQIDSKIEKDDFVETAQESDDSFIKVEESTTIQKQENTSASKSFGLPMSDTTDEWMTEDYGTINLEDA